MTPNRSNSKKARKLGSIGAVHGFRVLILELSYPRTRPETPVTRTACRIRRNARARVPVLTAQADNSVDLQPLLLSQVISHELCMEST